MTSPILISVIIPCYNVEAYIEECLDSVYAQTYSHIEVIVVDNNSSDQTVYKVNNYKKINCVNLILIHEKRQGSPYARNKGLSIAKGKWIQFLDADDLLMTKKIAHQVSLITEDIELITGATIERNVSGDDVATRPHENVVFGLIAGYRYVGSTCSNLWKKQTLLKLNGFDVTQKSSQEIDLMFRMFVLGSRFKIDSLPLTIIRTRVNGQIGQQPKEVLAYYWLNLRMKQINFFFIKQNYTLHKDLMIHLFELIMKRIYHQAKTNNSLSEKQYNYIVKPVFNPFFRDLNWGQKIKLLFSFYFGFRITSKVLDFLHRS